MSDEILASIYSDRSKHTALSDLKGASKMYSSILPTAPSGESIPTVYDIVALDESSQAKASSTFVHRLPTNHWVVDSFLVVKMKAPATGTTAPRVGGNLIKRMTVRNGDTISEYEYGVVLSYVLSRSTPAERAQILSGLGGSSAAAETVMIPLLTFWTPLGSGSPAKNNIGLPAFLINVGVEVEITFNADSALLAASSSWAGTAYDSVRVIHLTKKTSPSVYQSIRAAGNWNLWTYDYQTTSTPTVLPDGVQTRVDLSQFDGSSSGIFFNPVASASIVAGDRYAHAGGISSVITELNGAEHLRVSTNVDTDTAERVLEWLAYTFGASNGQDGGDATLSHNCRFVPFGASLTAGKGDDADNQISNVSGANLRDFTKIDMLITNDSGGELQTYFMNLRYANYFVKDGQLFRRK